MLTPLQTELLLQLDDLRKVRVVVGRKTGEGGGGGGDGRCSARQLGIWRLSRRHGAHEPFFTARMRTLLPAPGVPQSMQPLLPPSSRADLPRNARPWDLLISRSASPGGVPEDKGD